MFEHLRGHHASGSSASERELWRSGDEGFAQQWDTMTDYLKNLVPTE